MRQGVVALVFEGGQALEGGEGVEGVMTSIRREICLDTIERLLAAPSFDAVVLVTSDDELAHRAADLGARVERTARDGFRMGPWLLGFVEGWDLESVVCLGGASAPLATSGDFETIAAALAAGEGSEGVVVANNLYSADIVGFRPAGALRRIHLPDDDNFLAYLLQEAGLKAVILPEGPVYDFDVDTPADLAVLALHPRAGGRCAGAVEKAGWGEGLLAGVMDKLRQPHPRAFLAGRVSPGVMAFIRGALKWRLRVVSEERGMKAFRKEASDEVRSITGSLVDCLGDERFLEYIGEISDVAFIDTRVLFSHWGLTPSVSDRYNSDLKRPGDIFDSRVRAFTRAAAGSRVPVILGGHSLVNGGVWALADTIVQELAARSRITSLEF
ncbi:MAG: hypothetical protein HPY55_03425 [Firmicutes bacterium]|nr:hypothetical protein [Bacillota bacterium]